MSTRDSEGLTEEEAVMLARLKVQVAQRIKGAFEDGRREEREAVVAWLRRWVAVRPSVAGHFADVFERGDHLPAAPPKETP